MNAKERLEKQILAHKIKDKLELKIENFNIVVYPGIFVPNGGSSIVFSRFFAKFKEKLDNVLEMGCGSGIISLLVSKHAKMVTSADINPLAVKTAKENVERNNLSNIKVLESDLFSKIKEKFDLIIFNPPFMGLSANNDLEKAFTDKDHDVIKRFFKQVQNHLTENGKILLEFGDMGGEETLEEVTQDYSKKIIYEENIKDFAGVQTHYYVLELKKLK